MHWVVYVMIYRQSNGNHRHCPSLYNTPFVKLDDLQSNNDGQYKMQHGDRLQQIKCALKRRKKWSKSTGDLDFVNHVKAETAMTLPLACESWEIFLTFNLQNKRKTYTNEYCHSFSVEEKEWFDLFVTIKAFYWAGLIGLSFRNEVITCVG